MQHGVSGKMQCVRFMKVSFSRFSLAKEIFLPNPLSEQKRFHCEMKNRVKVRRKHEDKHSESFLIFLVFSFKITTCENMRKITDLRMSSETKSSVDCEKLSTKFLNFFSERLRPRKIIKHRDRSGKPSVFSWISDCLEINEN